MIAPTSEGIEAGAQIESLGRRSIALWPQWLAQLPLAVFYRNEGTLWVWHREHSCEAARVEQTRACRGLQGQIERIEATRLAQLEPALGTRFLQALLVRGEAQVDNRGLLQALAVALEDEGVGCHWETLVSDTDLPQARVVVDCRGMGAKASWPHLRGVRGEIVRLHAPEVELRRVLRLLAPRHGIYIIPRPEGRLVVGATSIESDDQSPVSVRGALELLTSAYSVLPALAEARILELNRQIRPALPDNAPSIRFDRQRRVLSVNGLYRHGFLLTPAVVEEAVSLLTLDRLSAVGELWPSMKESLPVPPGIQEQVNPCL
jgi:glycine oxidase